MNKMKIKYINYNKYIYNNNMIFYNKIKKNKVFMIDIYVKVFCIINIIMKKKIQMNNNYNV